MGDNGVSLEESLVTLVRQEFEFHAAHVLPWHPGKCAHIHGHSYLVEVEVEGELDERGVVIDFDDLSALVWTRILEPLDHSFLNDHLDNPTAERLGIHIMLKARENGLSLSEVRVRETSRSVAVVRRARQ